MFTDYDELDLEIENPKKSMSVRVIWKTPPSHYNNENIRKVWDHLKEKYDGIVTRSNQKKFLVNEKIDTENIESFDLEHISKPEVQEEIFRNHLDELGYEDDFIKSFLDLHNEVSSKVKQDEVFNIEWDILKFWGENFKS